MNYYGHTEPYTAHDQPPWVRWPECPVCEELIDPDEWDGELKMCKSCAAAKEDEDEDA